MLYKIQIKPYGTRGSWATVERNLSEYLASAAKKHYFDRGFRTRMVPSC